MTRKQRNGYECGPIAIYNSCEILDVKHPSLAMLSWELKTTRDGTDAANMKKALKNLGLLHADFTKGADKHLVAHELLSNGVVLLGYFVGYEGHYTVLSGNGDHIIAHNWAPDSVVANESHTNMRRYSKVDFDWVLNKVLDPSSEIYILRKKT